jgi:hypothetical protein
MHVVSQMEDTMSDNFNSLDTLQDSELDLVVGGDVQIGHVSTTVDSGSSGFGGLFQNLLSSVIDGLNQAASNQRLQQHDRGIPA